MLLLLTFGPYGCGETQPGPPDDDSALAGLRLWVEVDYMPGFDWAVDYVRDNWRTGLLQGDQIDDCTFLYSGFDLDIDLQMVEGSELAWTTPLAAHAGILNFLGTDDQILAIHTLLQEEKNEWQESEPNLHLVVVDQLIDPAIQSLDPDPDRWLKPWRYDDTFLPTGATLLGWVIFDPINGFLGCNTGSFTSDGPVGVVMLGALRKAVDELNEVLDLPSPEGCGGASTFDYEKVATRLISHELLHELGIDKDIDGCHDTSCKCVMNPMPLRRSWQYFDKRVFPSSFNCTTAATWISNIHTLCVGEADNEAHWRDVCSYASLRGLNPSEY